VSPPPPRAVIAPPLSEAPPPPARPVLTGPVTMGPEFQLIEAFVAAARVSPRAPAVLGRRRGATAEAAPRPA
jgi:hypothetical protein